VVGPAGPLRVNKNGHLATTETAGNRDVSLCLSHSIVSQRDDGKWSIGFVDDAPDPFESRRFAEAVAGKGVRDARTS
jgi:hypothetical protein